MKNYNNESMNINEKMNRLVELHNKGRLTDAELIEKMSEKLVELNEVSEGRVEKKRVVNMMKAPVMKAPVKKAPVKKADESMKLFNDKINNLPPAALNIIMKMKK